MYPKAVRTVALISLLASPVPLAQAVTCDAPWLREKEPFERYTMRCEVSNAEAVALLTSPQTIVPAVPGAMLLPRLFAVSKKAGPIYTTAGVTQFGIEWFGGEAETPVLAMAFNAPGHYVFDHVGAANMVIYNPNGGFAPYAFAAGYTVDGAGLRLVTRGANMGGGTGPLTIKLEWQVVPMEF